MLFYFRLVHTFIMPYDKRTSYGSVVSNTSSSSSSSTPSSTSSINRSPLGVASTCPDIMENDGDDDGEDEEPYISIGPEMVDEHPFDPSISDEVHARLRRARQAEARRMAIPRAQSSSLLSRFAPGHSLKPGASVTRTGSWRSRFRLRKNSSEELQEDRSSPTQKLEGIPEPGVLLSCTHSSATRWGLVPLDAAQERSDIVRRPEGFEMNEQKQVRPP